MALRQRRWVAKASKALKKLLGGKCVVCQTTKKLTFDLIIPNDEKINGKSKHHKMEWSWRVSFYRRQYRLGNLQLLCEKHNNLKNNNPF